ncbi:MAG: TetR/AcrR family transcriptional regulator [Gemmatirosa sp.]|nr:TetR/AcrR family transcriptional regulator [Gemmatirosa sp.]
MQSNVGTRQALAKAAFDLVAERGFEGLRTRDVAARVGVNVATLHYHFATKDDLVVGVARYLAESYAIHRPAHAPPTGGAVERLRNEIADARQLRLEHRPLQRVSLELRMRSERDPALRAAVDGLASEWRTSIEGILRDGVREGAFRADLDPAAGASLVLAVLWGAAPLLDVDAGAFDAACAELERALAAPPAPAP